MTTSAMHPFYEKKRALHRLTVSGPAPFPIDMLRWDGCHPRREADSKVITASFQSAAVGIEHTVQVNTTRKPSWRPSAKEWMAKGWKVVSVEIFPE